MRTIKHFVLILEIGLVGNKELSKVSLAITEKIQRTTDCGIIIILKNTNHDFLHLCITVVLINCYVHQYTNGSLYIINM